MFLLKYQAFLTDSQPAFFFFFFFFTEIGFYNAPPILIYIKYVDILSIKYYKTVTPIYETNQLF